MTLTNAELREQLKEAKALIEAQQVEIEATKQEIGELKANGKGWLVEVPSPLYSAVTLGVQFVRGQAFIREKQAIPAVQIKPTKESYFDKMGYTENQRQEVRQREAMSDAERAVIALENDFGYTVTYFDGSETAEKQMEKMLSERAKDYAAALEMFEAQKKAQDMIAPQFMGA